MAKVIEPPKAPLPQANTITAFSADGLSSQTQLSSAIRYLRLSQDSVGETLGSNEPAHLAKPIQALKNLEPNWDGDDAQSFSLTAIARAQEFWDLLSAQDPQALSAVKIFPGRTSNVGFVWAQGKDKRLDIWIRDDSESYIADCCLSINEDSQFAEYNSIIELLPIVQKYFAE
jgi:hypothetical protein